MQEFILIAYLPEYNAACPPFFGTSKKTEISFHGLRHLNISANVELTSLASISPLSSNCLHLEVQPSGVHGPCHLGETQPQGKTLNLCRSHLVHGFPTNPCPSGQL